jgi:hypothetical protein
MQKRRKPFLKTHELDGAIRSQIMHQGSIGRMRTSEAIAKVALGITRSDSRRCFNFDRDQNRTPTLAVAKWNTENE